MCRWLLVAMLSLSLGFHWTLLQSVAWAGMLVEYSQQGSFAQAVVHTFDGQHPCPLCKMVRSGKNSESKAEGRQAAPKFDLFAECPAGFYFPPTPEPHFFLRPLPAGRLESPPLPPPRIIAGQAAV